MKEFIITSSVLILVVIALRYLLKGKISLRLQYALWALVLVRLLVPVTLFESPISVMNAVRAAESARETYTAATPTPTLSSAYGDMDTENAAVPSVTEQNVSDTVTNVHHHVLRWTLLAEWVWFTGIGIVGLCLLLSNLSFGRKLRKTRKRFPADGCRLPVYQVEALPSPCLFGLFRPAIYITPDVSGDEMKLRHVLAHELTHYRHGDHIWSMLRGVCLAVHWYHPLVWLATVLSRRDAELACDEATIQSLGEANRMEYGRTLIGLTCEKRGAMDLLCCATTMTDGKKGIRERIALISKKPKRFVPALIAVFFTVIVAVGCTFTGAKIQDVPSPSTVPDYTEEYQEIYPVMQKAEETYAWFTGYGEISLDTKVRYFDNGSVWYGIVTEDGISPMSDLQAHLSGLYDSATCEALLATCVGGNADSPLFLERDGVLYGAAGVVGLIQYSDCDWTLGIRSADEDSAAVVVTWNMTVWDTPLGGNYEMHCVKGDDGLWRFTDFVLPAQAAAAAYDAMDQNSFNVPDTVLAAAQAQAADDFSTYSADYPDYDYVNWRIDTLEKVYTYDGLDGMTLDVYEMTDQFLSDAPGNVMLAGGMSMTDDGWVWHEYFDYLIADASDDAFLFNLVENDCSPGTEAFTTDLQAGLENYESGLQTPEKSADKQFVTSADIDRDGKAETFYLDKSRIDIDSGDCVTLRVYDGGGHEIWSEEAGVPHAGWNSLFLCNLDGEKYLLRYNPYMGQGDCTYTYTLFTLEGGAEKVYRTNTLKFDINGSKALDAPKMVAFANEVNALLEKSTLLVSSEGGAYSFGPAPADAFFEKFSWLDEDPNLESLYSPGDDLQTKLEKYSEYAVSNREGPTPRDGIIEEAESYPFGADFYGYITDISERSVSVDKVNWDTDGNYDNGYRIINGDTSATKYPLADGCQFWILKDYWQPCQRLDYGTFSDFLSQESFRSVWVFSLNAQGEVVMIGMQYQP